MAGEIEAMGFDRTDDERMHTTDSTAEDRVKAMQIAEKYSSKHRGDKRVR